MVRRAVQGYYDTDVGVVLVAVDCSDVNVFDSSVAVGLKPYGPEDSAAGQRGGGFGAELILCLADISSARVGGVELVELAVAVFETSGVFEGGGESYEQGVVFSLEVFCYIEAVGYEHVLCLADEFFVEPDLCDGVEAFEDKVYSVGFEEVLWGGECFFVDPWFSADPMEVFGVCVEVGGVDSAGVDEGGKD